MLVAVPDWGDRYLADPEGPPLSFAHRDCGAEVRVELRCAEGHGVDDPRESCLARARARRRTP